MKKVLVWGVTLIWCVAAPFSWGAEGEKPAGTVDAGVASVDITPTESVLLAGSPARLKSSSVGTRLFVRALVLSTGGTKIAIVTLDTLKYPVEPARRARQQIEKITGIPASNVIICASHTHRGPLWPYYKDQLVTPIAEAVARAARQLTPCQLGIAKGKVADVSQCRRVRKDGQAWNRWLLPLPEREKYPAEGPFDPECEILAVIGRDQKYKAIVYNFACHATNTRDLVISADYPGDVQQYIQKHLSPEVATLFLTGACGDVNPVPAAQGGVFGEKLGAEIIRCLGQLKPIANPTLTIHNHEIAMPGREHPELPERDIAIKWPQQLEHYKKAFHAMQKRAKPHYPFPLTGIRIGDDFAIVSNPAELFCEIGMSIKKQSPFPHTMTVEQTNGAHGYVPTAKAFQGGSYETWFGEHSYLTPRAGEIIEKELLKILNDLKRVE
ncbi:MAG: hypothetical protein LC104_13235 [Bacteroidales bacterium]|nr:hypothetical protein [Bacteroidales bacterium]